MFEKTLNLKIIALTLNKEDVRWIQKPHFSDREARFLVFRPDEYDDQDCYYQLNQNFKTEPYKLMYVPQIPEIRKLAKVMWVRDRSVGAQFSERKLYEQALGFYLQK